jgi:group I intron endonuclease
MITIYLITCLVTGQQYVGKTARSLIVRWGAHCSGAKSGHTMPLAQAIRKYGPDAFAIDPIAIAQSEEEAGRLEAWYIQSLRTLAPHGLNIASGGKNGYLICEAGRKSMTPKNPWRGKRLAKSR